MALLVSVSWADGITPPDGSFTVPEMLPTGEANRDSALKRNAVRKFTDRFIRPLVELTFIEWKHSA